MTTRKSDESHRPARVAARILRELSAVLARDFDDPRVHGVVLSAARMSDDLSLAKVRFALLGEPDAVRVKQATRRLKALTPALRARLAERVAMRYVPRLEFEYDADRGEVGRVEVLLREVEAELGVGVSGGAESDGGDGHDEGE